MEQSKRLLELGLKPETADMHHFKQAGEFSPHLGFSIDTYKNIPNWYQPAWSLHRLIEMYVERYISCNINLKELTFDWLINEIEIHNKDEDFNKEYLEQ
jgi:hypothetical protein